MDKIINIIYRNYYFIIKQYGNTYKTNSWIHIAIIIFQDKTYTIGIGTQYGHAEVNALNIFRNTRVVKKRKIKDIKLYSIRFKYYNDNLEISNAEPCFHCCKVIKENSIYRVKYSDNNGKLVDSFLDNMHYSLRNRVQLALTREL